MDKHSCVHRYEVDFVENRVVNGKGGPITTFYI
jgi:hypothetical protein